MGSLRVMVAVAAVSAFVQSTVWSILSLLPILIYACNFDLPAPLRTSPEETSYSFRYYLIAYFINPSCDSASSFSEERATLGISFASQILLINILQFFFNLFLSIVSILLICIVPTSKIGTLLSWTFVFLILSIGVSIIDTITTIMFSSDRQSVVENGKDEVKFNLSNLLFFLILIACRGIIFWILNVCLSVYLTIITFIRLMKVCCSKCPSKSTDSNSKKNGILNSGFQEDGDYPDYCARSRWPAVNQPQKKAKVYLSNNIKTTNQTVQSNMNVSSRNARTSRPAREAREQSNNRIQRERKTYHDSRMQQIDQPPKRYSEDMSQNRVWALSTQEKPEINHGAYKKQVEKNSEFREERSPGQAYGEQRRKAIKQIENPTNPYSRVQKEDDTRNEVSSVQRQESINMRPGSLQEAILTVRPLRQVRPKLSHLQNRY